MNRYFFLFFLFFASTIFYGNDTSSKQDFKFINSNLTEKNQLLELPSTGYIILGTGLMFGSIASFIPGIVLLSLNSLDKTFSYYQIISYQILSYSFIGVGSVILIIGLILLIYGLTKKYKEDHRLANNFSKTDKHNDFILLNLKL